MISSIRSEKEVEIKRLKEIERELKDKERKLNEEIERQKIIDAHNDERSEIQNKIDVNEHKRKNKEKE